MHCVNRTVFAARETAFAPLVMSAPLLRGDMVVYHFARRTLPCREMRRKKDKPVSVASSRPSVGTFRATGRPLTDRYPALAVQSTWPAQGSVAAQRSVLRISTSDEAPPEGRRRGDEKSFLATSERILRPSVHSLIVS